MTKDRASNIQMQSGWSNKRFAPLIAEIFSNLTRTYVLNRLQLDQTPLDSDGIGKGLEDCQCFFQLCVAMASLRAWTMMVHRVCQPDGWLGILDEDPDARRDSLETLKKDVKIITDAWTLLQAKDANVDWQASFFFCLTSLHINL